MAVDIVLFPLDTIKTRIQATISGKANYVKSTGSKFSGLKSQVIGSFPSAAAFFSTYDFTKHLALESNHLLTYRIRYKVSYDSTYVSRNSR
jgi:hypothetical protein